MIEKLDDILKFHHTYLLLGKVKNSHIRSETDDELAEKIRYRLDSPDWLIYIDGNTIRRFIRGFAFCSTGISFCDDNGVVTRIDIGQLTVANVSNTGKSLLINGKSITLGDSSKIVADQIVIVKKDLKAENNKAGHTIKIAKVKEVLWYAGYEGQVRGPFDKTELQKQIMDGVYDVDALLVWNSSYSDWMLISQVKDFDFPIMNKEKKENVHAVAVIDVNNCDKKELIRLPGMTDEKVDAFLERRKNGIILKNIYELQKEFALKPHEVDRIKPLVEFHVNSKAKTHGRVLDV